MASRCRYFQAHRKARALRKQTTPGDQDTASQTIQDVWDQQHQRGAQDITAMLRDLKGFYLKLGQILGSKADVLPQAYTDALSQLFDSMPATSHRHIRRTVRRELGQPIEQVKPLSQHV